LNQVGLGKFSEKAASSRPERSPEYRVYGFVPGNRTAMTTPPMISAEEDHWKRHAIGWDLIGPPLRPSADELAVITGIVSELMPRIGSRRLSALILGVTPEYARLAWPPKSSLVALERCATMIQHVWPGSTAATERVIQGDWLVPEAAVGPFDLVLGDGVLSQLAYPSDYERFCQAMRGVTRPGGRWAIRLYARTGVPEDPERLLDEVRAGRLTNINEFKLRLGMALCDAQGTDDVGVAEMWRFWDQSRQREPGLPGRWSTELQTTIENYREGTARYTFPRLDPVLDLLRRFATIRDVRFPSYPLGGSCPMVVLEV
jgi:hypothetical protein